jgi:hypothetical protein
MNKIILLIVSILFSNFAFSKSGVVQSNLEVKYMYMKGGYVYVTFNPGSMDGCYGGFGGVLYKDDTTPMFAEIYSTLLTMQVTGGFGKGAVIYTVNNSSGNWSDCTINGLELHPGQ